MNQASNIQKNNSLLLPIAPPATTHEFDGTPFLKWAGGKSKIADEIIKLMPTTFDRYFEPFLGGGSIALRMLSLGIGSHTSFYLSDMGEELINCWAMITIAPGDVSNAIDRLSDGGWTPDKYYILRGWDRSDIKKYSRPDRAARFILLNKLGFRGLCRYNAKGQFNVPWGDYKSPAFPTPKRLEQIAGKLRRSWIVCSPFDDILRMTKAGGFVYLDPPYVPLKRGGFTSYSGEWSMDSQKYLFECLQDLDRRGVKWLLSGHDEPFYRELYTLENFKKIDIRSIQVARSISVDGDREKVAELLIKNY